MRLRARRLLGVSALSILFGLGVVGCSDGQQDDENLEASDNNQAADDGGGNNAANDDGGGKNATAEDNGAGDGGSGETADAGSGGGNATENDLQDIITEMNGQQGGNTAAAGDSADAKALQQDVAQPAANAAPAKPAAQPQQAAAEPQQATMPFQPGGTPAGAGLPEIGSKMAYIVEKGDTLAKISQKIYGSNKRWQEMATLSGITKPSRIFPGDLVYYTMDEGAVAFSKTYQSIQRSEEQVKPGDTLATIAQRIYGTTQQWRSLWRHNDKIDNPDIVTPGTTVYYVPKGAMQAALKAKVQPVKLATKQHNLKKQNYTGHLAAKKSFKNSSVKISKVSFHKGSKSLGNRLLAKQMKTVVINV